MQVFRKMDYELEDFPEEVRQKRQNISVKFSALDFDFELSNNFSANKNIRSGP